MRENGLLEELQALIRIAIVSKVNPDNLTARVKYLQQGTMSGDMKVLQNHPGGCPTEGICPNCGQCKWLPKPGQYVLCILIPGGDGDGIILGGV